MAFTRAKITQLRPHVYLIDDAGESTCYLICGSERALLVDSVNGMENLREITQSLTDLPVTVVNTHGHCDHIYGNVYFDEAWLHPADLEIAKEHFGYFREEMEKKHLTPCPFLSLEIGQMFDLGGVKLEIIDLKGHTPGSIGLLDREARLLYSGDGLNPHLWMQLDHSLPIAALRDTLIALKEHYGTAFDFILTGHAKDFREAKLIDQLLAGCEDLLSGRRENDLPYHYFGGECLQHPITDIPGEVIVYSAEKL